jgi:hypothetical protein
MATVEYVDDEPNGIAMMLGGLIEANLAQHPEREALLKPMAVAITAPDAGVSVTIRAAPGRVTVANGVAGPPPDLQVRADSATLVELSSVPLSLGLPDLMTKEGRAVNRRLLKGEIKVRGMVRHLGKLARFNKLLSVR